MPRLVGVLIALWTLSAGNAQTARRRTPKPAEKPTCARGAICFSGEVMYGQAFRRPINDELEFVLEPGWTIAVKPRRPEADCDEFASVVNTPLRGHKPLYMDTSYGWTAEDEVSYSPREFQFVTNCADYRQELERLQIVLWPYTHSKAKVDRALARLGSVPAGNGRLWITASKVSHEEDTAEEKLGRIEWMRFTVELALPAKR